jgi:hypothetical protein
MIESVYLMREEWMAGKSCILARGRREVGLRARSIIQLRFKECRKE